MKRLASLALVLFALDARAATASKPKFPESCRTKIEARVTADLSPWNARFDRYVEKIVKALPEVDRLKAEILRKEIDAQEKRLNALMPFPTSIRVDDPSAVYSFFLFLRELSPLTDELRESHKRGQVLLKDFLINDPSAFERITIAASLEKIVLREHAGSIAFSRRILDDGENYVEFSQHVSSLLGGRLGTIRVKAGDVASMTAQTFYVLLIEECRESEHGRLEAANLPAPVVAFISSLER